MKITVNGSKINYKVMGEGKAAIFFSGFENDMSAMIKSMEPIFDESSQWKRIYVDHPGVGETEIGQGLENVEDVLNTMLSFVDEIVGDENYILGGYSFGGFVTRYIVSKRLEKVDGVFLLTPLIHNDMMNLQVDRSVEAINHVDESLQEGVNKRVEEGLFAAMKNTNKSFMNKLYETNHLSLMKLDEFEGTYNKPTLIITGRQDDTVGYKDAYHILDKYPRATYIAMDKCGHAAQFQQDNLYRHLVTEWVYRVNEERKR